MFSILSRRCPLLATSCPSFFCLLSMLIFDSRFDSVWFRLSCDHGWIRSGLVNVRKQQQQYVPVIVLLLLLPLFLSLSLSVCLCSRVPHNDIAIYLPAFLFFRSYNEVFAQTAFIPYYLSTDIDFVCVQCTSSSAAAVAYLSLPLSLSVSLFRGTSHNIAISVPTLLFFRSYNEVFVQTAFIAYFPSGKYYFAM